jgi:SPP1 family predicted phage head-tail adaptor
MRITTQKTIAAEDLKERITFVSYTVASDGEGGTTPTQDATNTVWGQLTPLSQSRALNEMQLAFNKAVRVYVRYPLAVTTDDKILFDGEYYTIHSILGIDNQHQYLKIIAYV